MGPGMSGMSAYEMLTHKATAIIAILTVSGTTVGFLDARHAGADEVESLSKAIHAQRIESIEEKVEESERRIVLIQLTPTLSRSPFEIQELSNAKNTKEKYLRKLHRIESRIE